MGELFGSQRLKLIHGENFSLLHLLVLAVVREEKKAEMSSSFVDGNKEFNRLLMLKCLSPFLSLLPTLAFALMQEKFEENEDGEIFHSS